MLHTTPTITRYTGIAIALHWVLALAIGGSLALGTYMSDLPFYRLVLGAETAPD